MVGRLRHSSLVFLFALLGAGCSSTPPLKNSAADSGSGGRSGSGGGGVGGSGGSGGGSAGSAGLPDWGERAAPTGSFDVRLLNVSPELSGGPKLDRSPSDEALLRFDFPTECASEFGDDFDVYATPCVLRSSYKGQVLVTAQGGASAPYDVELTEKELILSTGGDRVFLEGAVAAEGDGGEGETYFVSDRWSKFTFALDARGQVVPPVQAVALQTITLADGQQVPVELNADGSFHPDRTVPKAELVAGSSFSPPDARFPWDPVAIRFDEPVLLAPGLSIVTTPVGAPFPAELVWRLGTGDVEADPPADLVEAFGSTLYRGYWRGWDAVAPLNNVKLLSFEDASGNVGVGFERELAVRPPPPPSLLPSVDFELAVDDAKVVLWGGAAIVTDGCEGERCLRFEFDNAECGATETAGAALRLQAPEVADRSTLRLQARVLVEADGPGGAPAGELKAFTVQVLWAGSEAFQYDQPATPPPRSWGFATTSLAPPVVPGPPATPPPNPNDVAVVLRSGNRNVTEPCRKSVPAPVRTRVTIDSIAIEPVSGRLAAP
jgi:hypothetical protein